MPDIPVRFVIMIATPTSQHPMSAFDDVNDVCDAMGALMADEVSNARDRADESTQVSTIATPDTKGAVKVGEMQSLIKFL